MDFSKKKRFSLVFFEPKWKTFCGPRGAPCMISRGMKHEVVLPLWGKNATSVISASGEELPRGRGLGKKKKRARKGLGAVMTSLYQLVGRLG